MTNAYQDAVMRRAGKDSLDALMQGVEKQDKENEERGRAILGDVYDHMPEDKRDEVIQSYFNNSKKLKSRLSERKKAYDDEAKEAKDLEQIIGSAPRGVIGNIFPYTYDDELPESELKDYQNLIRLYPSFANPEGLIKNGFSGEEIEKNLKKGIKLAMEMFKIDVSDIKDDDTREFLYEFADEMAKGKDEYSREYTKRKFVEYASIAQKYVGDKENDEEVREYFINSITDKNRAEIYERLTSRELAQAA